MADREGDRAPRDPHAEGAGAAAPRGRAAPLGHRALAQHALLGVAAPPRALSAPHVHEEEPVPHRE